MKPRIAIVSLGLAAATSLVVLIAQAPARVLAARERRWGVQIQPGDVIFQDLRCGERCDLIRESTHSRKTHVGIVLDEHGDRVVWEAFAPVGPTPLVEWVRRGLDEKVAIYRFTPPVRERLPDVADAVRAMRGRLYDGIYQWDDDAIYCSELVAKAVNQAMHSDVFKPHPIGSLGPHEARIRKLSGGCLSPGTLVVSPVDLARSPALERLIDEVD